MSDDAQMSDQPSQEELQAYLEQLRDAPVGEVVLQALSVLGTGAEVKLGRRDARVLIDSMEALLKIAGPHLGDNAAGLEQAIGQLKVGQVQIERQGAGEQGDQAEEGEGARSPEPPPQPSQPAQGDAGSNVTDRLWIPGRG